MKIAIINWIMVILGLLIHVLIRLAKAKGTAKENFKYKTFVEENYLLWVISFICSTALLLGLEHSGALDTPWGPMWSVFVGYQNSSMFRYVMEFFDSIAKSKLNNAGASDESKKDEEL